MANNIPFTAYLKIVPDRGNGKRFEIWRSREKMAALVNEDLASFLTGNVAMPGGSITWSLASNEDSLSTSVDAVASKPAFGEFPDTLTVVGFYSDANTVPFAEHTIISHNQVLSGPTTGNAASHPNVLPNAGNVAAIKALKTDLENAITSVTAEVIKIEVNGVAYGQGGYHFPL